MEHDGKSELPERIRAFNLAEYAASLRNQQLLPVVRIDIDRRHAVYGTRERSIEAIGQDGLDACAFQEPVPFARGCFRCLWRC